MNTQVAASMNALYAHRRFIVGVAVGAAVVGIALHFLVWKPSYIAEVKLVITSPTMGSEDAERLVPEIYHARAYEDLLMSTSVIGKVRERLIESNAWANAGEAPPLEEFRNRLSLSLVVLDQTTRPVNYSPFITLSARGKQPKLARVYVDTWANVAVETAERAAALRVVAAAERFEKEKSAYEADLEAVWEAQAEEEAKWSVTVLNAEIENRVELINLVKDRLLQMEQQAVSSRQQLESAQSSLAKEEAIVDLFHAPSDDVYWLRQGEGGSEDAAEDLADRGFLHQSINQVYVQLRESESEAMLSLAEAEAAANALRDQLAELEQEKLELQESLAEHKRVQKHLDAQESTLSQIYKDVARIGAYTDVAAVLSTSQDDGESVPIGINRINEDIYMEEADGLLGSKARLVLLVGFATLAACAYVVIRALSPFYVGSIKAATQDQPVQ